MRKIVISDTPEVMENDYKVMYQAILNIIPDAEIKLYPYEDEEGLVNALENAEGLLTTFLPINRKLLHQTKSLKCVSISAAGYQNVNLEDAKEFGVAICHIAEYCTDEVAEHTLAFMLGLNRNLKYYGNRIEKDHIWRYHEIDGGRPLKEQTLAIFGFGKIGQAVAVRAKAFGMKVIAVDPYLSKEIAQNLDVMLVDKEQALREADIISNHMNLTEENYHYFNLEAFEKMRKHPFFINVGRGGSVNEADLIEALDRELIKGAGLDVLEEEEPVLKGHPILNRDNVLITPHSAFYSDTSFEKHRRISGENLAYYLTGNKEKVFELV
ncbi:C-terminal binding protein [Anaerosacchariphilus polymeriproducens]|uniref:C-terminal binding protein n=1 Tax=Anaerosacchariphilus polymeriproducens TaxID=1812858 RepID=A0A371AZT3_9FIRM|nr:C-terminal binding protein [Anaerosacchariphilus polymeriproducens]RDU25059.1 C-terminal binding protein [Anaerosacchariphilus polymeriproducens]